ncbi:MAG: ABC transporter substrate-binding protein [Terrimicrobiaceae bacterium]|nr:ABC transporter substrate-binding protein [Terrimicrobiaceae bacterium]
MRILVLWAAFAATAWAESPSRIVSIGGAATETVFAIGAGDRVVGVDTTSTFPSEATKLPQVGYQRALSAEGIASLNPDLVILPATAGPPTAVAQLEQLKVPLLRLEEGHTVEAAANRIREIGEALGLVAAADKLAAELEREAAAVVPPSTPAPRVLFVMSAGGRAPMVAGTNTAADSAIRLAGGQNVVTDFEGYKQLTPEALVTLAPEVIVTTSRTVAANGDAKRAADLLPGLEMTPAGQSNRLVVMEDLYLLGFGPRAGEALGELARRLADARVQAAR